MVMGKQALSSAYNQDQNKKHPPFGGLEGLNISRRGKKSESDELVKSGYYRRLGAVVYAQLVKNIDHVGFGRVDADGQGVGDFRVGKAIGD